MLTVLWDNDGVLVDTEGLFFQATQKVLRTVGLDLTPRQVIEISLQRGESTFSLAAEQGLVQASHTRYPTRRHGCRKMPVSPYWEGEAMDEKPAIIEAAATPEQVRRVYDLWSHFYGFWARLFERRPQMLALESAAIQPQNKVLEVAVGAGGILVEIVRKIDRTNTVSGIDISPKMLRKARRQAAAAGYTNIALQEGDARSLPFPNDTFDVLFNSYMFDLLPLKDMPVVLGEFHRVLKPSGRLVLVNMSKERGDKFTWWERLYQALPRRWAAYLLGGCRPVLLEPYVKQAGFVEIQRRYLRGVLPTEIIIARKVSVPPTA